MLIKYSYLDNNNIVHGDFQSDTDDFKKFFRKYHYQIEALTCHLQDGRIYIWQNPKTNKNKYGRGWNLINKI